MRDVTVEADRCCYCNERCYYRH